MSNKKVKKQRAWELDFLRGLAILLVVFDHVMLDIADFFGYAWMHSGVNALENAYKTANAYMESSLRANFWILFIFIFFFVSGACTSFSRNNLIRGIKLAGIALLATLGTYLAELIMDTNGLMIIFGVLHCVASCILLFALLDLIIGLINKKKNRGIKAGALLFVAIIVLILNSIYNMPIANISTLKSLSDYKGSFLEGFFVFRYEFALQTADYFPLLPYFGFFLIGAAFATIFYPDKKSLLPKLDGKWHYPVTIPGRLSLIIYVLSQVVIVAICALVSYAYLGNFGL